VTNQVSGLAGYNFYLDDGTGHKNKLNTTPVAEGIGFTISGLASNTDYSGLLYVSSVDMAGNESALVAFTGLNAKTLNPTPEESPMGSTDVAAIDAIMTRCFAAGAGPSVSIANVRVGHQQRRALPNRQCHKNIHRDSCSDGGR
jgi:hypothetical protein